MIDQSLKEEEWPAERSDKGSMIPIMLGSIFIPAKQSEYNCKNCRVNNSTKLNERERYHTDNYVGL